MRYLASLVLILAAGCHESDEGEFDPYCGDGIVDGDEVCDDGNRDDTDACPTSCGLPIALAVDWKIKNAAGDSLECAPNADTARIRVQPTDGTAPTGAQQTFVVPCVARQVTVTPSPQSNVYSVVVELALAADGRVYGTSPPVRVDDSTGSLAHAVITVP